MGVQSLLIPSQRGSKIHRFLEALTLALARINRASSICWDGCLALVFPRRQTHLLWLLLAMLEMPSITAPLISSSVIAAVCFLSTNGFPESCAFFMSRWRFLQAFLA